MAKGRVFVVYDDQGRIKATAVPAHDQMIAKVSHGLRVHIIDHPGLDRKEMTKYLAELHANHRVEVMGEPKLVKKPQAQPAKSSKHA